MSKTKISEFSSDPALNTDIDGINIAEGCAPSGINNAIRELMSQLKDWQSGTSLDTFNTNYMIATAVDINGGAIDGAVIGGASAAAGTFTTATATTFNATTVDSTNLEVTNIKAKDGTAAASIADSTGVFSHATTTVFPAGAVGTPSITTAGDTNTGIFFPAADTIGFVEGGAEVMRIDSSARVGIGTSSPVARLGVAGAVSGSFEALELRNLTANRAIGRGSKITFYNPAGSSTQQLSAAIVSGNETATASGPEYLAFETGTAGTIAERMRITSSGNVLVGATSVTGSATPRLYIAGTATDGTQGIQIINYKPAIVFSDLSAGNHNYQIASDGGALLFGYEGGTAGSSNTFTERMRIDSSGNVGIGTTSPLARLHVQGNAVSVSGTGRAVAFVDDSTSYAAGVGGAINFRGKYNAAGDYVSAAFIQASKTNSTDGNDAFDLLFGTRPNGDSTTERMRIDSSGDYLFLGGTLRLKNAANSTQYMAIYADATSSHINAGNDNLIFYSAGGERMRITSAGEVYIAGTTDRGAYNLQCNGTGVWGAGAYVNGSDERLKENIANIESGLDVVTAMRPVTFTYKEDYSKDQSIQTGFIAQELQQAMSGKNYVDGIVQAGPEYLNVAYQNLIPILTKAIQELKVENDALKSRLDAAGL